MAEVFTKLLRSGLSGEELLMEVEQSEGDVDEECSTIEGESGTEEMDQPKKTEKKNSFPQVTPTAVSTNESDSRTPPPSEEFDDDKYLYPMRRENPMIMDPGALLDIATKRVGELTASGDSELAIKWRVKCVGLVRLTYGDNHWKLGQAYCELARAYLDLKGMYQQALQHGLRAKGILLSPLSGMSKSDEGLTSLVWAFVVIGHASLHLSKYDDAVRALKRAHMGSEKLVKKGNEDKVPDQLPLRIITGLGKSLCGKKQFEEARDVLQKGLVFVKKSGQNREVISVLRDLSDASAGSGDYSLSVSSLEEAQSLVAKEFGSKSEEMAQIEQKLAKALMSTRNVQEEDRVIELMMSAYQTLTDLELGKCAAKCLEDLCKYYLQMNRLEDAIQHLKTVIKLEKVAFGDPSSELGESHRLIGTIYLSQGRMAEANKHLKRSLNLLTITLGKKHKCTVEVGRVLALAAIKGRTKSAVSERPRFKTVFGSEAHSTKSSFDLKGSDSKPSYDNRPPFTVYLKHDAFW